MKLYRPKTKHIFSSLLFAALVLNGCFGPDELIMGSNEPKEGRSVSSSSDSDQETTENGKDGKNAESVEDKAPQAQKPSEKQPDRTDKTDPSAAIPERVGGDEVNNADAHVDPVPGEQPVLSDENQGDDEDSEAHVSEEAQPVNPETKQQDGEDREPVQEEGPSETEQPDLSEEEPSSGEVLKTPESDENQQDGEDREPVQGEGPSETEQPDLSEEEPSSGEVLKTRVPDENQQDGDAVVPEEEVPSNGPEVNDSENQEGVHTLSFDLNGGEGEVASVRLREGESIPAPWQGITRENATFMGWNSGPERGGIVEYAGGRTITMGNSDITLYAVWRLHPVKVVFTEQEREKVKGKTLWVHGVTPPKESDWRPVRNKPNGSKTVTWQKGLGWYDTDQFWDDMCWGAAASNVLHWWLEQNSDYIKLYEKYKGITLPGHGYRAARDSDIYGLMKSTFGNHGNKSELGFTWYLSGIISKPGGGYFKDVFHGVKMFKVHYRPTKDEFSKIVTEALQNNQMITEILASHATAVWGARYDENGYVDRLYYTQSNDWNYSLVDDRSEDHLPSYLKTHSGLLSEDVVYINDTPKVESSVKGRYIDFGILVSYSLGRDLWKKYFADKPGYQLPETSK